MSIDNNSRMFDSTKLVWHMDRVMAHFDRRERVAPIHIDMGLSKFCNIKCKWCFGQFQNIKPVFIQKEPLLQFIKDADSLGIRSLGFIGDGDPTMNPYLYDALAAIRRTNIDVAISTNGVLVDNHAKCNAILLACTWMRFCIAAGTREGYRRIHGKDYFDKAVANITRIVKMKEEGWSKCDLGMQSVYVPGEMDQDMIDEAKLAVDLGVDYFVIKQCSLPSNNQAVGGVTFDVSEYSSQKTIDVLKECESYSNARTKIIPKYVTMARQGKRLYPHCPAVPLIQEMSGNGDMFPCGYFFGDKPEYEKYKFGNIHEMTYRQIFESDRYWNIIKHFREEFDSDHECFGSCRLDSCNKFVDEYLNVPKGKNFI